MKKKQNNLIPYVFLLVFIILCMIIVNIKGSIINEISTSEFMEALENNEILEMTITNKVRSQNYKVEGKLKDYKENETFSLYIPLSEEFMKLILDAESENGFKLTVEKDSDTSSWYVVLEYVPMCLRVCTYATTSRCYDLVIYKTTWFWRKINGFWKKQSRSC